METVKDRLRQALKRTGWSIHALQKRLHAEGVPGSSYANVHAYFKGATQPPVEFLARVAGVLSDETRHVRPEWLAFGRGEWTEEEELARRSAQAAATAGAQKNDQMPTPAELEAAFLNRLPALQEAGPASWHAIGELYEAILTAPNRLGRWGDGMRSFAKARGNAAAQATAMRAVQLEAAEEAAALVGAAAREAAVDLTKLNRWFLDRYIQTTAQALAMLFVAPHRLQPGPVAWGATVKADGTVIPEPAKGGRPAKKPKRRTPKKGAR